MSRGKTKHPKLTERRLQVAQENLKYRLPRSETIQGFHEISPKLLPSLEKVIQRLGEIKYRSDVNDKIWTVWVELPKRARRGSSGENTWVDVVFREFNFSRSPSGKDQEFAFGFGDTNFVVTTEGGLIADELDGEVAILDQFLELVLLEVDKIKSGGSAYLAELSTNLPPRYKFGVIKRRFLWDCLEKGDLLKGVFGGEEVEALKSAYDSQHSDSGFLEKPFPRPMTAGEYFKICEICYDINDYARRQNSYFFERDKNEPDYIEKQASEYKKLTPREKYKKYADGRDCGLTEIDPDSPEAFADWLEHGSNCGGHPWEIARGGNSTHISLYVTQQQSLILAGDSMARLEETVRFAIELYRRGIPFRLVNIEKILKALSGEDFIGLVPESASPKYAQHYFREEHEVLHVLNPWYLSDVGDTQERLITTIRAKAEFYPVELW